MTEQDGQPPAGGSTPDADATAPHRQVERGTPLAEAAAGLGFAEGAAVPAASGHPASGHPAAGRPASGHQAPGHPAAAPPSAAGVPPRQQPLPPPRPVRPAGTTTRPASTVRPVARARKARLVLRRIDPWSVFLYSVVASIFIGFAMLIAVAVLYAVLSKLGVLSSLNTLIGEVTAAPGATAAPSHVFTAAKVMTFATLIAALDVVLITALSTLGAFLYNLCAALTGGIEVTLSDQG